MCQDKRAIDLYFNRLSALDVAAGVRTARRPRVFGVAVVDVCGLLVKLRRFRLPAMELG